MRTVKIINVFCCIGIVIAMASNANAAGQVFVAGEGSDNVVVMDATTNLVVATINTGAGSMPHNPVNSPDNRYVYVTLKGTGEVAKIDAVTNTLVTKFSVGTGTPNPIHLDVSQDGNWLYVVNQTDDTVVKMSTSSGSIVGSYTFTPTLDYKPHDINVSPDGNSVWITDETSNMVTVLDTGLTGALAGGEIGVGDRPIRVAFSADGSQAFVTNYDDPQSVGDNLGTVSVIDVATLNLLNTFDMGGSGSMGPMGVVADPDGTTLWLAGTAGNTIHGHSLSDYSFVSIDDLLSAHGLDISDDGKYLYTSIRYTAASGIRDAIAIIDTDTMTVEKLQTVGLDGLDDGLGLHGLVYVSAVPIPAAIWLFGSGLFVFVSMARRNS